MNISASRPHQGFRVRRSPLALAPLTFIAMFVIRSLIPIFDPIFASITVAMIVVVTFMFLGKRWSGLAFLVFPVALFTTPGGREFSFNLSSVDNTAWRWHAIVGLLSMGVGSVVAVQTIRDKPLLARSQLANGVGGLLLGVLMITGLSTLYPMASSSRSFTPTERTALPSISLLNYGIDIPDLRVRKRTDFHAVVRNPSDLPHTLTIAALNIEVYVPARRWAILEIGRDQLPRQPLLVYCTIADHRSLGMERTLEMHMQ
jgi:hypothetical protein